jgi:transposase
MMVAFIFSLLSNRLFGPKDGGTSLAEISQEYGVHQSVLHTWKKTLLEEGPQIFEDRRKKKGDGDPTKDLERKVGQLTMAPSAKK